jgi:hypothetical protein
MPVTPLPTLVTTPAPSWPPSAGSPIGVAPVCQVVVGVAHARGMHLDLDFVCDGIAHVDLVDAEARVELPQKRAFGLHPSDLS